MIVLKPMGLILFCIYERQAYMVIKMGDIIHLFEILYLLKVRKTCFISRRGIQRYTLFKLFLLFRSIELKFLLTKIIVILGFISFI